MKKLFIGVAAFSVALLGLTGCTENRYEKKVVKTEKSSDYDSEPEEEMIEEEVEVITPRNGDRSRMETPKNGDKSRTETQIKKTTTNTNR